MAVGEALGPIRNLKLLFNVIEAHKKKVCQIADRVVIRIYDSVADAPKATGIERSNISLVANGKRGSAGGFEWRYYDV